MSALFIGAQAVGLMRSPTDIEDLLKGCKSSKALRELHEKNLGLNVQEQVLKSTKDCKIISSSIFERLVYSKKPICTFQAASDNDNNLLWGEILKLDETLLERDSVIASIKTKKVFMEFYYESFQNVYGNGTTEKYRPSLNDNAKRNKNIPFNPSKQTTLNVGETISREECGKTRLLHASKKVTNKVVLQKLLEDITYSCSASLQNILEEDEEIISKVFVRGDLTCISMLELPYYSANYESVCIQCGGTEYLNLSEDSYPL